MSASGSKSSSKRVRKYRFLKKESEKLNKRVHLNEEIINPNVSEVEKCNVENQNQVEQDVCESQHSNLEEQFNVNVINLSEQEIFSEESYTSQEEWSNSAHNSSESSNENNEPHGDEESNASFEEISRPDESKEITALREWAILSRIPNKHLDSLLGILRQRLLPDLPKCAKSFLHVTDAHYEIHSMTDTDNLQGEFSYLSIKKGLQTCVNVELHENNLIELDFNIDGVKLHKSSPKTLWPVLCKIYYKPDIYKPFTVAVFYGNGKPKSLNDYMKPFVSELNDLLSNGINIRSKQFAIKIKSFICDTPARSYVKNCKGHMSFDGCERCKVKGEKIDNITVFLQSQCERRTDEEFRQFSDVNHHNGPSPLLVVEPQINLVSQFILDPMHLIYLGVMLRLLECWMKGSTETRISANQKTEMNRRTKLIKSNIPHEFHRKLRSTDFYDKYKAVELRFFLLYCCPIVCKKILNEDLYKHLLLLHVACRMLSSTDVLDHINLARNFLEKFVDKAKELYGQSFISLNVHNLIHMADDVESTRSNLNSISAFPYESELGKIKNILFSPYRTIAQYCRRLHTEREVLSLVPKLPKETFIIKESMRKGIEIISHKQYYFSTKHPDNTAQLTDYQIIRIHKILCSNANIYLQVTKYRIKKSIFTYPCDSTMLNMYEIEEDRSQAKKFICIDKILQKLIKFHLNFSECDEPRIFTVPLIH